MNETIRRGRVTRSAAGSDADRQHRRRPGVRALADVATATASIAGAALVRLSLLEPAGVWWAGAAANPPPVENPSLGWLLDGGELAPLSRLAGDERFDGLGRPFAVLTRVPVVEGNHVIGTLCAFYGADSEVRDDWLPALTAMARLAAATASRLAAARAATLRRTQAHRLATEVAAGEAERGRRVARELHEGLANQLAGTALLVQSLARRAAALVPELESDMQQVGRQLHCALAATRTLATGSLPYILSAHGLVDALKIALRRLERDRGARLALIAAPRAAATLSAARALCLLEIAVQLVEIARAHQGESRLTVRLRDEGPRRTVLSVAGPQPWYGEAALDQALPRWRAVRYHARRAGAEVRPFGEGHPEAQRRIDVCVAEPRPRSSGC
jgi:Histidine kinase